MLSDQFLSRLDALNLRMKQPAGGGSGGLRRSKALGSSVEFSDFREYVHGDDLRRVDWNAYARFDRLFLKLFMEEQEQRVHLIVDDSASMAEPTRWECAKKLLETISYLALSGSDTVTLYALSDNSERHTRPLSGRFSYPQAVDFLEGLHPSGITSFNRQLPLLPLSQGRGVTVAVSDLLLEDGYDRGLQSLLYRKQESCLVHLLSREEWEPTLEETTELWDSETGERLTLDASYELLKRYREKVTGYVKEVEKFCLRYGVTHSFLIPQDDCEAQLLRELSRIGLIG